MKPPAGAAETGQRVTNLGRPGPRRIVAPGPWPITGSDLDDEEWPSCYQADLDTRRRQCPVAGVVGHLTATGRHTLQLVQAQMATLLISAADADDCSG
jgi:hypothetical protein